MSDEQQQGNDLVKDLRATIERISAERDEFKSQVKQTVMSQAFNQYGLDPNTGAGKLAASAYDGDLSADSVTSWLDEQGFSKPEDSQPEGMSQRVEQRQKLDSIEDTSSPAGRKTMSKDEHRALLKADPQAAMKAFREGRVEFAHQQG